MRWCALQYARRTREKQAEASWAYTQSVLTTLGNITIAWAGIEMMLTHLVLWHHVRSGIIPVDGLPRMLSKQLDYVKRTIEKDESLDIETRQHIAEIRRSIFILNEFRISVTHGVVHQRNRRTMDWHTQSIKIQGLTWRVVNNTFSNDEIQDKSRQISELGNDMSPFIASIIGMSHPALST